MDKKFSKEIFADKDSYYMSCPEIVSKHLADNLSYFNSAIELCCGVGITSIQLAKKIKKVTGIDIDQERINCAEKNSLLYNVSDKVKFICGDVLNKDLLKQQSAEVVILDPDWSLEGTEKTNHVSDLSLTQPNLRILFNLAKEYIAPNMIARVPKTFNDKLIRELGPCKIENIYWGGKLRFRIAYFLENIKEDIEKNVFFD